MNGQFPQSGRSARRVLLRPPDFQCGTQKADPPAPSTFGACNRRHTGNHTGPTLPAFRPPPGARGDDASPRQRIRDLRGATDGPAACQATGKDCRSNRRVDGPPPWMVGAGPPSTASPLSTAASRGWTTLGGERFAYSCVSLMASPNGTLRDRPDVFGYVRDSSPRRHEDHEEARGGRATGGHGL